MLLLWCLSMIQVFSYPLGESSFHLFVDLKKAIVFVCGRFFTSSSWDVFHKPSTSMFFSLLISQQLCSNLLFKDALSNSFEVEHVVFFSVLFIAFFHFSRGIVMMLSSLIISYCEDHVLSFAYPFNRSVVSSLQFLFILSSFLLFSTGVFSKLYHSYAFSIFF